MRTVCKVATMQDIEREEKDEQKPAETYEIKMRQER